MQSKSRRTLIDPIPCFMQFWTNAINAVQNALIDSSSVEHDQQTNSYKVGLLKLQSPDGQLLDYDSISSCLIGEIHGFSGKYDDGEEDELCKYCTTMCSKPARIACDSGGDKLIKFKITMYNHMIDEHGLKGQKIDLKKVPKIQDMVC